MAKFRSHLTGKAIIVSHPDHPEIAPVMLVEISIDCPTCGEQHLQVAGHHLRALRDLIIEFIDLHPNMVGEEAGITRVGRTTFAGTASPTPEDN